MDVPLYNACTPAVLLVRLGYYLNDLFIIPSDLDSVAAVSILAWLYNPDVPRREPIFVIRWLVITGLLNLVFLLHHSLSFDQLYFVFNILVELLELSELFID